MSTLICFPKVGANVAEGTVGRWLKSEGERVEKGEPLVELITSKATFEVESPEGGVLRCVLAPEKSVLPVGYVLAVIGDGAESLPDVSPENARLLAAFHAAAATAASSEDGDGKASVKVRATPAARRIAKELGVDLAALTLPEGVSVVREDDVRRAAEK